MVDVFDGDSISGAKLDTTAHNGLFPANAEVLSHFDSM